MTEATPAGGQNCADITSSASCSEMLNYSYVKRNVAVYIRGGGGKQQTVQDSRSFYGIATNCMLSSSYITLAHRSVLMTVRVGHYHTLLNFEVCKSGGEALCNIKVHKFE